MDNLPIVKCQSWFLKYWLAILVNCSEQYFIIIMNVVSSSGSRSSVFVVIVVLN